MGGAGSVDFDIEAQAFGGVGDLHGPGEPAVQVGIDADEVGGLGEDEIDVLLEAADVLALQQRRADQFTQFAVGVGRDAAVLERVFVPEVVGIIEGAADLHGVSEGVVFAGRVDHQVHLVADGGADGGDGGDFLLDDGVAPAVDLEGRVAPVAALDGEIGVGGRAVEHTVAVAVIGAGVTGEGAIDAAKQLVDRGVVELAGDVPEGYVDGAECGAIRFAQGPLEIVVDRLALQGVLARQVGGDQGDLGEGFTGSMEELAGDPGVGVDLQGEAAGGDGFARGIGQVESGEVLAHVGQWDGELGDCHGGDYRAVFHGDLREFGAVLIARRPCRRCGWC